MSGLKVVYILIIALQHVSEGTELKWNCYLQIILNGIDMTVSEVLFS